MTVVTILTAATGSSCSTSGTSRDRSIMMRTTRSYSIWQISGLQKTKDSAKIMMRVRPIGLALINEEGCSEHIYINTPTRPRKRNRFIFRSRTFGVVTRRLIRCRVKRMIRIAAKKGHTLRCSLFCVVIAYFIQRCHASFQRSSCRLIRVCPGNLVIAEVSPVSSFPRRDLFGYPRMDTYQQITFPIAVNIGQSLSLNRRIFSGCVPGSIFTFTLLSTVGISEVVPSIKSGILIKRLYIRLFPSRIRSGCDSSWITTSKSPFTPPCRPVFPFPETFSCIPSPTPAGILILTTSSPLTTPSPAQLVHLFLMTWPSPLQVGQVVVVCICPSKVLVMRVT